MLLRAEPLRAHEDLQQVVEARGGMVLDVGRSHDELELSERPLEQVEVTEVLEARGVEERHVPAVVDDALGVRVRETDPCQRRVLETAACGR